MNKKVVIPIGLMLLAAVSYRSAQNQMEDIERDFKRSFEAALEDRSSGFVDSARERMRAEKTKLWSAIQEEVEVEQQEEVEVELQEEVEVEQQEEAEVEQQEEVEVEQQEEADQEHHINPEAANEDTEAMV